MPPSGRALDPRASTQDDEEEPEAIRAVEACATRQLMQDTLNSYYFPLEIWYTRTIIDKVFLRRLHSCLVNDRWQAHSLSKPDFTQFPSITTTPDDAFYILKIVLTRLLSTGNLNIVKKTSEALREVMDRDYAGVIKKKLDDVYRTGSSGSSVRSEKESRQAFIVSEVCRCQVRTIHMLRRSCSMTWMFRRLTWNAWSRTCARPRPLSRTSSMQKSSP